MSKREELYECKRRAVELMEAGDGWREASEQSGLKYTRRGIQRLYARWQERGEEALIDQRHGHPSKAKAEVREWLKKRCREAPDVRSARLTSEMEAEFGVELKANYITILRHQLGLPVAGRGQPSRQADTATTAGQETESEFSP